MSPMDTSESDELDQLPSVPRLRRGTGRPPLPKYETPSSRTRKRDDSYSTGRRRKRSPRRQSSRRAKKSEMIHSDDDENENDDLDSRKSRRVMRPQRRTLQARKIIEDDDDEGSDLDADDENSRERIESELNDKDDEDFDSKSNSVSPPYERKRKSSTNDGSSDSKDDENGEQSLDTGDGEGSEIIPGQNDLLAKLEEENDASEDFDSEEVEQEKEVSKSRERLTSRQRAMQGEDVKLEYAKLESPKSKKKEPAEDWDHDEEMELKKQQKARLRQMIHEKRNKEKRAAMVDKVLRGVTSKRKKFTLASEARAAQIGTRLTQNEMRDGCIRFVSNREGTTISIPEDVDTPEHLSEPVKASYPPACTRDPKTGKRVIVS